MAETTKATDTGNFFEERRLWLLDQEQTPGAVVENRKFGRYVFLNGEWRGLDSAVSLTPQPCFYCGHTPER